VNGKSRKLHWFAGLAFQVVPVAALAAPFCVQTQAIPPQCIYYDAASCNQRAMQLGGQCSVNPQELHITSNLGHYCLITGGLASSCIYADQQTCQRDAQQQQGACVQTPSLPESPAPDPFRDIRPLLAGGTGR
jgi:hypothetical protein